MGYGASAPVKRECLGLGGPRTHGCEWLGGPVTRLSYSTTGQRAWNLFILNHKFLKCLLFSNIA
jgi:hypothetical protein